MPPPPSSASTLSESARREALRRVRFLAPLDDDTINDLVGLLQERVVEPGTTILREGDSGRELYLIDRGIVRVATDDEPGAALLARLGPGEVFGEMAFLGAEARSAAVISESEAVLLVLTRDDVERFDPPRPGLVRALRGLRALAQSRSENDLLAFENEALPLLTMPVGHARLRIGRAPDNDIVLSDPTVSAYHAAIEIDGERTTLQDLDSAAGTYHQRRRVTQAELDDGDSFQIGSARLALRHGVIKRLSDARGIRVEAHAVTRQLEDGRRIVEDADLAVYPGELVSVVGPSGAGKTTLLRLLLGIDPVASGEVYYDSVPLRDQIDALRMVIGYVPQDDIIHLDLTLEQTLRSAAGLRLPADLAPAELRARVRRVLEDVELSRSRQRRVRDLSGGERKRASIAVELLAEPRVLFLDEPTTGLDPGLDERFMRLLRRMADEGRTIILTTHATRNLAICDRVVVVNGGRVVYTGPPDEALEHFSVEDFVEVYAALSAQPAQAHLSRYLNSDAYAAYVGGRLIGPDPAADTQAPHERVSRSQALRTVRHQVGVLTRRNARLMLADRQTLAIRLLTAPAIGAGLLLLFGSEIFGLHKGVGANVVNASALLYVIVVVLIFTTSATAAREISSEQSVYLRERLVNLSPLAYVLAKLNVLLALALVQTALLLVVVLADTNLLSSDRATLFNLYAAMLMISFTGVALGLLVSSFSGTSDQANLTAVVLVIPQLIFAGLIVPLSRMPDAARIVADVIPAKWSLELLGGLTDLAPRVDIERAGNAAAFVRPVTSIVADSFAGAFDQVLVWRWLCLAAFCAVFVALTVLNQAAKGSGKRRRLPLRPRLPHLFGAATPYWTRGRVGR